MRFVAAALLLGMLACSDAPEPSGPPIISRVERRVIPWTINRQIDVLFVIESSPAMTTHLASLTASYPRFMQALESIPLGLPDVHIGVVTADLGAAPGCTTTGQNAALQVTGAPVNGAFVSDAGTIDGTRIRNFTGELPAVFTQMASVGDQGCAFQRPLEAMKRALTNQTTNVGFLREDAYLAVVFITASDDCSFGSTFFDGVTAGVDRSRCQTHAAQLESIDGYVQFLKGLKTDPSKVIVSGVLGPSAPADAACDAQPAQRLHAFLSQFPNRSNEVSICAADPSEALALVGQLQRTTLAVPCWESTLADVDPETPGTQFGCAAWVEAEGYEATLPTCDTGRIPCYQIVEDPLACPSGSGSSIQFKHPPGISGSWQTTIECLVE